MQSTFKKVFKVGSLEPILKGQIKYKSTQKPKNIAGATITFIMVNISTGTEVIRQPGAIEDAENGIFSYSWAAGDTDNAGIFYAEFLIVYSNSKPETFPARGPIEIEIEELTP